MTKEYELQVKAWMVSENYTDGLRLWKSRYGENTTYRILCMGPNDFNREKMRVGLIDVPDDHPPVPVPKPKAERREPTAKKVAALTETVESLEWEFSDVNQTVEDLGDTVSGLSDDVETLEGTVENLEDTVRDLNDKVQEFLRQNEKVKPPKQKKLEIDEKEPVEVQKWRKTTYGLMDERTILKQKLRDLPDPYRREDRKVTAYRILDITAELDILFGQIGYFEEYNRLPSNAPIEEQGIVYPKTYLNLRTYVSRYRKQLKAATDPEIRKALEERIEGYLVKMKEIEIDL